MLSKLNLYQPIEAAKTRYGSAKCLRLLCDILERYGQKYWLDWGTLLGAYREGKIIDDDFDIDVGCLIDSSDFFVCPYHDSQLSQMKLLEMLQEHFLIRFFSSNSYISVVPRDATDFNVNHIDIGLYKKEAMAGPNLREFFFDEMEQIKLYDMSFPCPRHLDIFIPMLYGNDWKIPKPNFSPAHHILSLKPHYTCYTSMVGDFFHIGHQNLLQRCKTLFDRVIVGVHTDEDVQTYKPKPFMEYERRLDLIRSCPHVDEILEGAPIVTTDELLDKVGADFVVAGRENPEWVQTMYPVNPRRLHLIARTPGVNSSEMRKQAMSA